MGWFTLELGLFTHEFGWLHMNLIGLPVSSAGFLREFGWLTREFVVSS
ncbi:hypothetical protein J7J00_01020 [Bacillus sp. ISL-4]|nr:hypothetical protein [Bacillus sp. ISL-4]MBT2664090.1 hypothetical protein [Bacillus sp. ISL-4]